MTTCPSPAIKSGDSSTTSSDSGANARHTTRRTGRSVSRAARVTRVGTRFPQARTGRPLSGVRSAAITVAGSRRLRRAGCGVLGGRRFIPESGRPLHRFPIHRPPRRPNDASATQFANGDPARRPSGTPSRASNRDDRDPEPSANMERVSTGQIQRTLNLACGNRGFPVTGRRGRCRRCGCGRARRRW